MNKPRKRVPAEDRKKQILKCAVTVFSKSNYRTAKIADIAAAAGISEAMIYKYFPSKKIIFLKILAHISNRIIIFWKEELEKKENALNVLRNMGMTYYERMKKHPDELKVQFQAISEIDDKEIANQLRQDHINYMKFINSVLRTGVRQGTIKKNVDTEMWAVMYNGAGIVVNMMKLLSFEDSHIENNYQKLLDNFINLIRA